MEQTLREKCDRLCEEIRSILAYPVSCYLFGSVALNDYKPGWSDIDFLCLTEQPLSEQEAGPLLELRQKLQSSRKDPVYRTFEGGILWEEAFWKEEPSRAVYWGTSGQRIRSEFTLDCFSLYELLQNGIPLCGTDRRGQGKLPTFEKLRKGVVAHYHGIREHASETGETLYSCGWLFDIARCLYTLRSGTVIAKTAAGEWALENQFCPNPEVLRKALLLRKNPYLFHEETQWRRWCGGLGKEIQSFADVLEREIRLSDTQ